jgi:flavin reductase (DIM6/NTAB) family NADH-FMN oxidoreductase RutF
MEQGQPRSPATATARGPFVRIGARDNFYQTTAFIPMSFALVTTVNDGGETGIGPHALCYPFNVTPPYAMFLISRGNSGTATNLRRTGRCALNYIEFDADRLKDIAALGYPGQDMATKRKANPFTLVRSPTATGDASAPLIVDEAFQVIECSWDRTINLDAGQLAPPGAGASRFVLNVDDILLRERYCQGAQDGSNFPAMPIFYGFRSTGVFWFAEHSAPFAVAPPRIPNMELQAVKYLATRLDEQVRFTDDACIVLARIPRPFLADAMNRAVAEARRRGATQVDAALLGELGGNWSTGANTSGTARH